MKGDRDLLALRRSLSPDVRIVGDEPAPAAPERKGRKRPKERRQPARRQSPSEHDEQAGLFAWAAREEEVYPELRNLFAIPNGGKRHPAVAVQMKEEGQKAGVPDCFLAAARCEGGQIRHGLFVELKQSDRSNHPSHAQREWFERLRAAGYKVVVCYGEEEARAAILAYLALSVDDRGEEKKGD